MKKINALKLCMCAACIALHVILELFCTIRIGNDLKLTFASLPFVIIGMLCGPIEGLITGLLGTFLSQLLTFGITITTPFWVIPYALQGLIAGLLFRTFKKQLKMVPLGVSVFVSGFVSVVFMWIASYLDGVVFFKYFTVPVVVALIPMRLIVWVILSIIYTLVSFPVLKALRKTVR